MVSGNTNIKIITSYCIVCHHCDTQTLLIRGTEDVLTLQLTWRPVGNIELEAYWEENRKQSTVFQLSGIIF